MPVADSEVPPFAERVICFVDEPILSAFGSSTYVSVKRGDVVAALHEIVEAIIGRMPWRRSLLREHRVEHSDRRGRGHHQF